MHHKHFILETFTPLFVFIGAISLTDVNTFLGTIAGGCSAIYSVIKLIDHYKSKKHEKRK